MPDLSPNQFSQNFIVKDSTLSITNLQIANCIVFDGVILDTSKYILGSCLPGQNYQTKAFSCLAQRPGQNNCNTFNYYVSPSNYPGSATGSGTVNDPFLSLYYAFTKVYASYTNITLTSGIHYYSKITLPSPAAYLVNSNDPLRLSAFVTFIELHISGNSNNRPIVY